jgi:lipopolysaccharide biosynthesis glycosyltransferase
MNRKEIPIFFACDDNFVKFTLVTLYSIKRHASRDFNYKIIVLHTGITEGMMEKLYELQDDNFTVLFRDVTDYLESISDKLPIRDYYSKTTYFRIFIAEM